MYKRFIEGKKAVFFDLDGTIANTNPYWRIAFENVLKVVAAQGYSFDIVQSESGASNIYDLWDYTISHYNIKSHLTINELAEKTINELAQTLRTIKLYIRPGFWDLVFKLKADLSLKTGLVSNSTSTAVNILLTELNAKGAFDIIVTGDDVKKKKPDPQIYLLAAQKLGIKPKEVLVFEDSLYGVKSAIDAGMHVIVIKTDIPRYMFPENILEFVEDFDGIAPRLDYTADEAIKKATKLVSSKATAN